MSRDSRAHRARLRESPGRSRTGPWATGFSICGVRMDDVSPARPVPLEPGVYSLVPCAPAWMEDVCSSRTRAQRAWRRGAGEPEEFRPFLSVTGNGTGSGR